MVAALSLLIGGSALAQTANDAHRHVDGARVQAATGEWRKLSQNEINCVDHTLRARRSSVWLAIQQGVNPSAPPMAAIRAACRSQASAPKPVATVQQAPGAARAAHGKVSENPVAEYWTYDGSVLNSIAEGDAVKFFYVKPSPAAKEAGAKFGTILFEGKMANQKYVGTAYSFDSHCGKASFPATGAVVDEERRVELVGHRSRLDKSCKVAGNEVDNLTFDRVGAALADGSPAAAGQAAKGNVAAGTNQVDKVAAVQTTAEKAAPDKAAADKAAAEKVAAAKAATDKIAAEQAAAEKAAADKAGAEKAAADQAAAEQVAAEKAAAEKVAADKAAAEKAAAEKAAAEKMAAEKAAAEKIAAEKAASDKAAAKKAAAAIVTAAQAGPDKTVVNAIGSDVERARAEAIKAQADAERARKEAEKAIADIGLALAAEQSKVSFAYGLLTGLVLVGWGGAAFLFLRRRKLIGRTQAVAPQGGYTRRESDRLMTAVLNEHKRAVKRTPEPV
jgi:hypothetical protein